MTWSGKRSARSLSILSGRAERAAGNCHAKRAHEHGAGPVTAMVHPAPLYRIEGEPHRRAEGIYDAMNTVGAHEVLVQSIRHDIELWQSSDAEISQFLLLTAQRIQDLKGDLRFKYVTMFKNHGAPAGQEFDHPVSELTATTFVPRRVLYELRASRDYYLEKERCVFCDTLGQELRNPDQDRRSAGQLCFTVSVRVARAV